MTSPHPDQRDLQTAIGLTLRMLQDGPASPDEIELNVDLVVRMLGKKGQIIDRAALEREIQARVVVWQDESSGLHDPSGHVEWLTDARADRAWEFWDRYRRFLEDEKMLPPRVVRRLDQTTDRILRKLEDPHRHGPWRRTGLAVGQVQSGKTSNYIGLACKAADAGYKLIVILAGIHNNLRSQTQLRVDEGLIGGDTQYQQRYDQEGRSRPIGVGAMTGAKQLKIASLTTSAENGDFRRHVAKHMNLPIGDYPVVLVIKKHRSIIDYVRKWIVEVEGSRRAGDGGRKVVHDVPLLVVDDEADNASVDTTVRDEDAAPSKINGAIRELLGSFDKVAYVGYTATPFANIYIDPNVDHDHYGIDLFPDSFIENIPAPSNYLGPERVFGLHVEDPDEDDVAALPIFRQIGDHNGWMPVRHRKGWVVPDPIPDSLRQAINAFVLTCATRRARGQATEHNSMLVHVTRFTDVQEQVREQIDEHVHLLADSLRDRYGRASKDVADELRALWEDDFVDTTARFPEDEAARIGWDQVSAELRPALTRIQVYAINGSSQDVLEYYEHSRTGLSVIAVGGDKLSRGLTLEGLSISYYLRASRTYDTLLQMGRWFGYRPGYEDLCRLYTTKYLRDAYVEITANDNLLRGDFEEMAALGRTPQDFGLRVRASSAGLGITASNKMRNGVKVKLSYSGEIPETVIFSLKDDVVVGNFDNLTRFVARLDENTHSTRDGESVVWNGVSSEEIIEGFLDGYISDRAAIRVRPAFIAEYIRRCVQVGELGGWTVRLVGNPQAVHRRKVGPYEVGLITRKPTNDPAVEDRYTIRRVLSPKDESTDLTDAQKVSAIEKTKLAAAGKLDKNGQARDPRVSTGRPLREQRHPDQALLLLYPLRHPLVGDQDTDQLLPVVGYAISFPFSTHPTDTEYVVNEIWKQQEIDDWDDEDLDA